MCIECVGNLWNKIISVYSLRKIYYEHTAKSNVPGVDNITGNNYRKHIKDETKFIRNQLVNKLYKFSKYRICYQLKGVQYPRVICIPTQRDKIVAYAITRLLQKLFGDAAKTPLPQTQINNIIQHIENFDYGIKLDIHDFYGSLDHEMLAARLSNKINDEYILSLIEQAINIDRRVSISGENKGVPQGVSFSNALANIYLDEIDKKYKKRKDSYYIRYVDDIILLSNNPVNFVDLKKDLRKIRLDLNENKEKIFCLKKDPFGFIGYEFQNNNVQLSDKSVKKFINTLDQIIRKNKNNLDGMIFKLNVRITGLIWGNKKYGWMFYYSQITNLKQIYFIDKILRCKLLPRYKILKRVDEIKKLIRVYWEIRKSLHKSRYILNVDQISVEEKRKTIRDVLKDKKVDTYIDEEVNRIYSNLIRREITYMEQDVQNLS